MAQTQAAIPPRRAWSIASAMAFWSGHSRRTSCGRRSARWRVLPAGTDGVFRDRARAAPLAEIYRCLVDGLHPFGIGPPGGRAPGGAMLTFVRQRLGITPFRALWRR